LPRVFIHYFSGTGNTKRAVDLITNELKKSSFEVKQYAIGKDRPLITENADFNLFAFSILGFSAPVLVKRYLHRLPPGGGKQAGVFAVYAGVPGHALQEFEGFLKHKQFKVFLTGGACYPNNWTQMMNPPGPEEIGKILNNGDDQALIFAASFIKATPNLFQSNCNWLSNLVTRLCSFFFGLIGRRILGKAYVADINCANCGLCIKSCPAHTIRMAGIVRKRPYWNFNCEDCARCINICPQKAIQVSIPKLIFHFSILFAGVWSCFQVAGLVANRLPLTYRSIGWFIVLLMTIFIELWLQFAIIDRLFLIMAEIPGLKRFFNWSVTKNFNRYIAPGFKPALGPERAK
jgi:ferredoxin/flavodoxin